MWEFLSRKKEAPTAASEPVIAEPVANPEAAPVIEQKAEQATEKVNEKYAAILTQASASTAQATAPDEIETDAAKVGQATDAVSRVNQLLELAQVKGVAHAVQVARRMNDLYVLDTMHDELADKLYEGLKEKGLIKAE